ncbi:MAG TPA: response regulator [Chitinophagales bacterium]|nr:response regulator [Chitinophagales bacterium]
MSAQELKVLLIEDNPGDAFLMKFYLGESTSPLFQVSHAETVKAALELLSENTFDIILSDMNLPDSFGVDTIKSILSKFPGNLVIVLTGLTDEEVGLETVRYGAQDFLTKGKFDSKVLISSVMFAFERFKLNKQIDSFTKKLDEENSRLDTIQKLLNVGYIEYDLKTKNVFRSDYTLKITGQNPDMKTENIDDALGRAEDTEALKAVVQKAIAEGGTGEFTYKRKDNGKQFRVRYEAKEGKLCGVVEAVG